MHQRGRNELKTPPTGRSRKKGPKNERREILKMRDNEMHSYDSVKSDGNAMADERRRNTNRGERAKRSRIPNVEMQGVAANSAEKCNQRRNGANTGSDEVKRRRGMREDQIRLDRLLQPETSNRSLATHENGCRWRTDIPERNSYVGRQRRASEIRIICGPEIIGREIQKISQYGAREAIIEAGRLLEGCMVAVSNYIRGYICRIPEAPRSYDKCMRDSSNSRPEEFYHTLKIRYITGSLTSDVGRIL